MNHFAFTPPEERPVNGPWGRRRKKKGYDWRDSLQGRLPFSNSCPPLTLPPTAHTHTHSFTIAAKKLLLPYPLASFYIDVIHSHPIFISLSLFFFFFSRLILSFYPTWCGKKSFNFFLLQTASLLQDILLYIHYFWTTTSISPIPCSWLLCNLQPRTIMQCLLPFCRCRAVMRSQTCLVIHHHHHPTTSR